MADFILLMHAPTLTNCTPPHTALKIGMWKVKITQLMPLWKFYMQSTLLMPLYLTRSHLATYPQVLGPWSMKAIRTPATATPLHSINTPKNTSGSWPGYKSSMDPWMGWIHQGVHLQSMGRCTEDTHEMFPPHWTQQKEEHGNTSAHRLSSPWEQTFGNSVMNVCKQWQ